MSVKIDSTPSVTEHISLDSAGIDTWPSKTVLSALWQDQLDGVSAVKKAIGQIETTALATVERLRAPDSRLIYVGAGTSGVQAALDGLELPCTFGWPQDRLAVFRADDPNNILTIETAGDDGLDAARTDLEKSAVSDLDVVVTVSASGSTPYTCLFAELAKKQGALIVAVANNADAKLLRIADHPILLDTGPEVIAGSTRLKAGTSQKTALNLFSTLVMIRLGHVYDGMMVDLEPGNDKLRDRTSRMVATIAGVDDEAARKALAESNGHVKTAVLTATGLTPTQARSVLSESGQNLRTALIHIAEA